MAGAKKFNLIKPSGFGIHHHDTRNETTYKNFTINYGVRQKIVKEYIWTFHNSSSKFLHQITFLS